MKETCFSSKIDRSVFTRNAAQNAALAHTSGVLKRSRLAISNSNTGGRIRV